MRVIRPAYVSLNHEAVGTTLADLGQRVLRCRFIPIVMDRYFGAFFGKLQRDSATNASRASRD